MRCLGAVVLSVVLAACASAPDEHTDETSDDLTILAGFAPSYWQIDTAHPKAGEITLLSVTASTFWGERCDDDACITPTGISGTYKRSKTRLYLYDAKN